MRQFAFHDRDDTLTAVWVERYGAWTAERLMARQKDRRIDRIEEAAAAAAREAERTEQRLRARIARLEAGCPVDCGPVVAETLDAERVSIRDLVESRRTARTPWATSWPGSRAACKDLATPSPCASARSPS